MRFSLEPSKPLFVLGEFLGKNLDGDIASELRVPSAVDFAHGPGSEWSDNRVGAETRAPPEPPLRALSPLPRATTKRALFLRSVEVKGKGAATGRPTFPKAGIASHSGEAS